MLSVVFLSVVISAAFLTLSTFQFAVFDHVTHAHAYNVPCPITPGTLAKTCMSGGLCDDMKAVRYIDSFECISV